MNVVGLLRNYCQQARRTAELAELLAGSYSEQNEVGYFGTIGAVTLGVGLIVLAIAKPVRRGMRGVL